MEFIISGKNMDLTEALKDYVQEKLGKVEGVLNAEAKATVTLSTEKEMQKLEVSISAGPDTYRAETSEQDMYAAIDKSVDVLLGQIRKTKAKKGKTVKAKKEKAVKPPRAGVPNTMLADNIDLDTALFLLSLPKKIGVIGEDEVKVGIGRFGPYVLFKGKYVSIPKTEDITKVGMEKATELIQKKKLI